MIEAPYNPGKLLRCPNGCGWPIDFTFGLRPCSDCRAPLCEHCRKLWQGASYCKRCRKRRLDARAREGDKDVRAAG